MPRLVVKAFPAEMISYEPYHFDSLCPPHVRVQHLCGAID